VSSRFANMKSSLLVLVLGSGFAAPVLAQNPQVILNRAVADFENGRFAEAAAAFDSLANAVPDRAPYLWQRGIALYYAGRYDDCRRQFESHRTVNPDDVENAAWHFLCVARAESPAKATAALLPVGPDARVPMREVYQMFRGTLTPELVLSAAGSQPDAQFYGHLYVGLYFEALGIKERALEHIKIAASDRFERSGGYMHLVARVHLRALTRVERDDRKPPVESILHLSDLDLTLQLPGRLAPFRQ
jgi:lipoprotein NlpI